MRGRVVAWLLFSSVPAFGGTGWDAGNLEPYVARDPSAAAVTEETLLENDRFWPYQVATLRGIASAGREIPAGLIGVLVRAEAGGTARVDFGRDGIAELPIAATDLVERANRIRLGELEKEAPNFAWALGPRLIDASAKPPVPVSFVDVRRAEAFVTVFVDPSAHELEEIALALAPLGDDWRVLIALFAQGMLTDAGVYERLRAVGFPVPFLLGHLRGPYTRILLSDGIAPPAVALQTAEGRLLFESAWGPDAERGLREALAREFPVIAQTLPSRSRHENATRGTP